MQVAMIATYTHPIALGVRYISAFLKAHGQHVDVFFMRSKRDTAEADFGPALLAELVQRVRAADLIGMSLMTNTFHRACVLTEAIRRAGIKAPIVWGGTHPTVAPDESLEIADMVCLGEGERSMLELAETLEAGRDPTPIGGLAFRRNGKTVRNPVPALHKALDEYPFPDYDSDTHWVAGTRGFEPPSPENLRGALHRYRIETTRGCPYPCTFCNNAALLKVYKGKGSWVRKRSNENVIQELETVIARFPTIEAVNIVDDLFFIRSEENIDAFSRMYKSRVNIPLELDAFPNTISRAKVRSLSRLPVSLISMGIQSGSRETLKEIYKRPTPIEKIVEGINVLADSKIRAEYHYIVNNPFESDRSRIETLRFAATHHRGPAILRIFPLQFYPGTPLYDRAREAALIGRRHESAYQYTYTGKTHMRDSGYLDIWLRVVLNLRNLGVPSALVHGLISFIAHPAIRWLLDRAWFMPVAYGSYRVGRFVVRKMIYQPFIRPFRYLRRKPRYQELHPEDEVTLPRNLMRGRPAGRQGSISRA
ncbi:MAG: B12-binding domain-containing radical SAM protein [Phycisphaerae bacterium]